MKREIRAPFFCVNPKSYLYGKKSLELAMKADELAKKYDLDVLFTGKEVDLKDLKRNTSNLIITAQTMDGIYPERAMGGVLPAALAEAGVEATFLNHAECQRSYIQLSDALRRAKEYDILSVLCASTLLDAKALATFEPDIMICELNELIGTGKVADPEYMINSTNAVKEISKNTLVLQAAGISTNEDVYNAYKYGGEGTGCTSGIVCKADPIKALVEMIETVAKARDDFF